jgi:hypothetical protein
MNASQLASRVGGQSALLSLEQTPVFVKKIPLSDLEKAPENYMSTANFFDLPDYYQYGIGTAGSKGFGAWRELSAQIMSTEWVLFGECPHFPILYHWRVLPEFNSSQPHQDFEDLESAVQYWNGSPAVRKRLEDDRRPSASIALFLEHIPATLASWLPTQISQGGEAASSAVAMTERNLQNMTSFLRSRKFIHFDAHFRNILVNDDHFYLTDFGLATSSQFVLSSSEAKFFHSHLNYDRCFTMTSLVYRIASGLFGTQNCDQVLDDYAKGISHTEVEPWAENILVRYSPIAVVMRGFLQKFQTNSRTTPYPGDELNGVLAKLDLA